MTAVCKIEPQVSSRDIINVDYTHVARRASGIERITVEQFSSDVLSPLQVSTFAASSRNRISVLLAQMIGLPLHALRHRNQIYVFPGFPPSPILPLAALARFFLCTTFFFSRDVAI